MELRFCYNLDSIIFLTIIVTVILGLWRVAEKFIGLNIHPVLAAIFVYLSGLITAIVSFLIIRPETRIDFPFKKGMVVAILAGIFIVICDILIFYIFKKGGNVSIITPIISGGSIVVAVIIGILFFKELLTPVQVFAILAIIIGIVLLLR